MPLSTVTLTGTFEDGAGNPLSGTASFVPTSTVYSSGIPLLQPDVPVAAEIVAGLLKSASGGPLTLVATDNSGLSVEGLTGWWAWSVTLTIAGQVQPAWSFFLSHASLGSGPVDLYSLANTPASGAGFVSPMTTLGDLIYENATPAAARLAGDTSNTRKFLRTQASAGVAQAPAWDTIQAGDVPVLNQNTTGTAANITGTLDQVPAPAGDVSLNGHKATHLANGAAATDAVAFGQLGSAAFQPSSAFDASGAAATAQAASLQKAANLSDVANRQTALDTLAGAVTAGQFPRGNGTHVQMSAIQFADLAPVGSPAPAKYAPLLYGAVWGYPWKFYPEAYGAKGDARIIPDATIASGQLTTLTSATAAFTSADTGKYVMLNGGQGNNAQPLICRFTYVSPTSGTLSAPASGAVTNASAVIATDDVAAINSCVTAMGNYAMAAGGPFHAQLLLSTMYGLATPPSVVSGIAGSTACQIPLPRPAANGTTQKLILDILGIGSADANMYFDAATPNIQGSALISMCVPPFTSGTNPYPSVLGFQYAADASLSGGFANTKAHVDGLTVVIPYLGPQGGYDFRFLGGAGGGRFGAFAFGAPSAGNYNNLNNLNNLSGQQNGSSVGLYMPLTGNNDDCTVTSFTNQGFTFGVNLTEHCSFQRISSVYDVVGIQCVGGGAHIGASVGYASVEQVFAALQYTGASPFTVYGVLDCEQVSTWHVQDTQEALYGALKVHTNTGVAPAVLGGANCEITWDGQARSVQSAPSYTLGTAFQNPWWHRATILIAGGAVTGISIGPTSGSLTSLGITSGIVPLPSGWWMSISGTVKPTTFIAAVE